MKKRIFLIAGLASMMLFSCTKGGENNDGPAGRIVTDRDAFLAISIDMPQSNNVKADPTTENGTAVETKVTTVHVIGYDDNGTLVKVHLLSTGQWSETGTATQANKAIVVDKDTKKVFVVVNASTELTKRINTATTFAQLNAVLADEVVNITQANQFLMTNEGLDSKGSATEGLTSVTVYDKEDAALKNPVTIKVDRAMAKVKATNNVVVENGEGSVDYMLLNGTNKSFYPYAKHDPLYNNRNTEIAKYRVDPNPTIQTDTESEAQLNWYRNPDTHTWEALSKGTSVTKYCLENTMTHENDNQNFRNTTSVLIKARYVPYVLNTTNLVVPMNTSWFRIKLVDNVTLEETIHNLSFNDLLTKYGEVSTDTKAKFSKFLDKVLGTGRTQGFPGEGKATEVTLDELDAVANGGYKAFEVYKDNPADYVVEYFQKSVCYYEARILHDNRCVPHAERGRWGVVRNNYYQVSIDKMAKPGTPYIPEPGDPVPGGDDPNDNKDAYLSVSITINPWTAWTQSVDLGEKPNV